MKSIQQLLLVIILSILSVPLFSQFPNNFEFLEHRHLASNPGALKVEGDDIYYVSHNQAKPMTLVNKVGADKSFEVLFKDKNISCRSKLFEETDSSFQIVLYSLWDYDIGIPGIYVINVDGESVTIDTLGGYNAWPNNYNFRVHNIEKNKAGDWITFSDSLYVFNASGIINSSPLSTRRYELETFRNSNNDLFAIENESWNQKSRLYQVRSNDFVQLASFDVGNLRFLSHSDEGVYMGKGNEILFYDPSLTTLINSWRLPISKPEYRNANYADNELEVLVSHQGSSSIFNVTETDDAKLIYIESHEGEASYYNFKNLGNNQHLFTGTSDFEDLSTHVFFRNINIEDNSQVIYPKSYVAMTDLEVIHTSKDTIEVNVDTQGDTIISYSYNYDVSVSIFNNSLEEYTVCNLFSDFYRYPFGGTVNFSIEVDSLIPTSLNVIDTTTTSYYSIIKELSFIVPGADYMFNDDPNKTITTTVLSSTKDTKLTRSFNVFPNPADELLNLKLDAPIDEITIYDVLGYPVYYSNRIKSTIDISVLSAGTYLIHARTKANKHTYVSKFVKI